MPDEQAAPKTLSIADALKEGVKGAQQTGTVTFDDLDGASKAAVILLAVGAESAANVLRQMTPFEVQRLSGKMAVVRSLSRDLVLQVLREFKEVTGNNAQVSFDTDSFMQNMLTKAMGAEGASDLLGRLESTLDMSGIETLKRMESDVLYEMIKNEHPQIVATVMVFLESAQAAAVLKLFPDELRNELILRVALLEKVQPAALKELNEVMCQQPRFSICSLEDWTNLLWTIFVATMLSWQMPFKRRCSSLKTSWRSRIVPYKLCCWKCPMTPWWLHLRAQVLNCVRSSLRTWLSALPMVCVRT
jgi:hypothetical protein